MLQGRWQPLHSQTTTVEYVSGHISTDSAGASCALDRITYTGLSRERYGWAIEQIGEQLKEQSGRGFNSPWACVCRAPPRNCLSALAPVHPALAPPSRRLWPLVPAAPPKG